jgi:hypothetical protein
MEWENRRQSRARVKWPVVLLASNGHIFGQTVDISLEGALIRSWERPELMESFNLILKPPGRKSFMTVTAKKAWLTTFSWDHQTTLHGLGVEFTGMLDDDRHFLASRISEYLEENGKM